MSEWQPIETAPKDGTLVLLGMDSDPVPELGRWVADGGYWVDSYSDALNTQCFTPTRWLAIPPPPAFEPV